MLNHYRYFRQEKISHPSTQGLSLLEVIFSIGLVAIVLVALLTVMIGGLKLIEQSERVEVGTGLAREQVEQIKSYLYSPVDGVFDGNTPTPTVNGFPPGPYPKAIKNRDYFLVVRVTSLDERLRRVDVEVQSDKQKVVTLSTVILK